jgi:ABC-type bacteriocin/lantibiotic exporter with double-glycine peptidase domain
MVAMVAIRIGAAAYLAAIPFVGSILSGAATVIATGGATAFAVGCIFIFLANHLLWVVLASLACGLCWTWLHRNRVRRWLVRLSSDDEPVNHG